MHDLKNAIKMLAENAFWSNDEATYAVDMEDMINLIAEYNIYYIEPDQPQLELT